jgi:hypothetical protein
MSSIKITRQTTIDQLISLGLIKASQVTTWEKRANRQAVNARVKAETKKKQTRLNQAVACYIGANYKPNQKIRLTGLYQNFLEFYDFDKVAAHRAVSKSLAALVEEGVLVNNRATINNNCHMRHWIPEATEPAVESADEAPDSDE